MSGDSDPDFIPQKIECSGPCSDGSSRIPGTFFSKKYDGVVNCPGCWPDRVSAWALDKAQVAPLYRQEEKTLLAYRVDEGQPGDQVRRALLERCVGYADSWDYVKEHGTCLSLVGTEGFGKTSLAHAVCLRLIKRHWRRSVDEQDVCLVTSAHEWVDGWRSLYNRFPDKDKRREIPEFKAGLKCLQRLDDRMRATELLVIDELSGFDKRLPGAVEKLFALVDYRVKNLKPILVTENADSWDEVKERLGGEFGPKIVDRLIRSGVTVFAVEKKNPRGKSK